MFDHTGSVVGLLPGERPEFWAADDDDFVYELTCRELADGWFGDDRDLLPDGLESLLPGPYLAAIVSAVDPSRLNGYDVVRLMKARARLASHHEAGKYRTMAEVAFAPGDSGSGVFRLSETVEYAEVEIAAALTFTRSTSKREMSRAVSLSTRLSRVLHRFSAGEIDAFKVRVFDQVLGHLPDDTVDTVLDQVLDEASELTTGQLRARLSRLVMVADPDGAESSYEEGLADRHVVTGPNPDHTANFSVFSGPPDRVAAARAYVEERARALRGPGEERTLDQLRVDVALDLLSGRCDHEDGTMGRGGGRVNVTITAETLAGLSDEPAVLEGFGPVIAEIGRKTVMENVDREWRFTGTDQAGNIATGTLARRPTAAQKRRVAAEYPTCVMVGCRQPVYDCDLDHRKPHSQGGPTHNDNLEPLCRHHHMVRHHTQWRLERLPNGDHKWTSPLGHTYIRRRGPPD